MNPDGLFKVLLFCNIICSISIAIITPFFPPFAKNRGIDADIIGMIFSAHPIGASITAFVVGKILTKKNRSFLMSFGLIVNGCAMGLFASLITFHNREWTIIVATMARFINGIGYSLYFTPFYAYIPDLYPEGMEGKIAIGASMNAIGFMVGPVFGSIFYQIGGFVGPFLSFGTVSIITAIILIFIGRPTIKTEHKESELNQELIEDLARSKHVGYCQSLIKFEIFTLFVITYVCNIQFNFYTPIIANFLGESFGIKPEYVGYCMLGQSTGYGMAAFLVYFYPLNKKYKAYFLFNGLLISSISQFFYGPDKYIGISPNLFITLGAQTVSGMSLLFVYVLMVPYLNKYIKKHFNLKKSSSNISSALFTIAIALGQLTGPLLAGYLYKIMGFERAGSVMGIILLITALMSVNIMRLELSYKRDYMGVTILLSDIKQSIL